jgi:hypothetical protein
MGASNTCSYSVQCNLACFRNSTEAMVSRVASRFFRIRDSTLQSFAIQRLLCRGAFVFLFAACTLSENMFSTAQAESFDLAVP